MSFCYFARLLAGNSNDLRELEPVSRPHLVVEQAVDVGSRQIRYASGNIHRNLQENLRSL